MNRKGFTLIGLLIVVVIIGILAAIAIPKFANTKAKAYIASMKSDLRNLVTAEEAYFADSVKYTATTACTTPPTAGAVNFCVTTGNNLGVVGLAAGNGGWAVTITNNNLTTPLVTCAIFINTAVLGPGGPGRGPPPSKKARPSPFAPGTPPPPNRGRGLSFWGCAPRGFKTPPSAPGGR